MNYSIPHRETELELVRDVEAAKEFLKISVESTFQDGNDTAFIRALSIVIDAQGGGDLGVSRTQELLNEIGLRLNLIITHKAV